MAKKAEIKARVKEILTQNPDGLQRKILLDRLMKEGFADGTMRVAVNELVHDGKIDKNREKSGGVLYSWRESSTADDSRSGRRAQSSRATRGDSAPDEKIFYKSFAEYLEYPKNDDDENRLSECTKAVAWGGSKSGKMRTPDVVGVFRPARRANVEFPHEIVSAEIKSERSATSLMTAFGQACAYLLFSHKVYLAVPEPESRKDHLEARCHLLGIGLVYFNPYAAKIDRSIYQIVLRARTQSPDMFYVNEFVKDDLAKALYGH